MKRRTRSLIAIGLASALVGCGASERQPEKVTSPGVSADAPTTPNEASEQSIMPTTAIIGHGAISGCDLNRARKIIRRKVARGQFFKVMTITDMVGNHAESIAKNDENALINPGALVCKGQVTAFVGTSMNMRAKTTNTYNPVRMVRENDPGAGMMAADQSGQILSEITLSVTSLHFDRTQPLNYLDGLTDHEGRSYASVLPVDLMNDLVQQLAGQPGINQ